MDRPRTNTMDSAHSQSPRPRTSKVVKSARTIQRVSSRVYIEPRESIIANNLCDSPYQNMQLDLAQVASLAMTKNGGTSSRKKLLSTNSPTTQPNSNRTSFYNSDVGGSRTSLIGKKRGLMKKGGRLSHRKKLYACFVVFECLLVILCIIEMDVMGKAICQLYDALNSMMLDVVKLSYAVKIEQLMQSSNLNALTVDQNLDMIATDSTDMRLQLQKTQELYRIEYATILDKNGLVVVGANNNRNGSSLDPEGLVTLARRNTTSMSPVWADGIVSYAELKEEGIPVWLDTVTERSNAIEGVHPYESLGDGLIRWMVIPSISATGDLFYQVYGDLVSGKSLVSAQVATNLGYYAGIHWAPPAAAGTISKWLPASSTANVELEDMDTSSYIGACSWNRPLPKT